MCGLSPRGCCSDTWPDTGDAVPTGDREGGRLVGCGAHGLCGPPSRRFRSRSVARVVESAAGRLRRAEGGSVWRMATAPATATGPFPAGEVPPVGISRGLPPGPRAPAIVQTLAWAVAPTWVMDRCARRLGETFTLTFAPSGMKLVMVSDPEAVKTVFTAPPDGAVGGGKLAGRAGDGAELGDRADRARAHAPAQAAAAAVPRRADAGVRGRDRGGDQAGHGGLAAGKADATAGAHAEDHAGGDPAGGVRRGGRADGGAEAGDRGAARAGASAGDSALLTAPPVT